MAKGTQAGGLCPALTPRWLASMLLVRVCDLAALVSLHLLLSPHLSGLFLAPDGQSPASIDLSN